MQRTVGVPAREGRIVRPAGPADFVVVASEFAVCVAVGRGCDHRVVHGRVEDALGSFVRRHVHPFELLLPGVAGGGHDLAEIPVGNLRPQVLQRIGAAHGRYGDFQRQLLRRSLETDDAFHAFALQFAAAGRLVVVENQQFGDRAVAFQRKVDTMFRRPSLDDAVSDDSVIVDQTERRGDRRESVAFAEVDEQTGLLARRERVFVECDPPRSGQLGADAVVEREGVEIGRDPLVFVPVAGRTAARDVVLFTAARAHVAREGHDLDVAQIGTARTAEVRVRESDQHIVRIVVARTPVPAFEDVLRSDLHRTEGDAGPDEYMAVASCPDIRVHVPKVVFVAGRNRRDDGDGQQRDENLFHADLLLSIVVFGCE